MIRLIIQIQFVPGGCLLLLLLLLLEEGGLGGLDVDDGVAGLGGLLVILHRNGDLQPVGDDRREGHSGVGWVSHSS